MNPKHSFRLDPKVFSRRQRRLRFFLFGLIAVAIFAVLTIIKVLAPSQSTSLSIILTIVFLMVAFYFVYFRINARMRRIYDHFRIEVFEDFLLLKQLDQKPIRIPRESVKSVGREADGRIRLDPVKEEAGAMVFPPDLEDMEKVEKVLNKWVGVRL